MGIVAWLVFGLVAGLLAKFLLPEKAPGGLLATILLGIIGAAVGGWIGTQLGFGGVSEFDFRSMLIAVAGSCLCLIVYALLTRGKA
jgi:uncharacterized membrane protein YeaQ/YmgE (transglycosylase-associated protein family)